MKLDISNYGKVNLKYLILDYNGTIALDGKPLISPAQVRDLAKIYKVIVLSGNTYSGIEDHLSPYALDLVVTPGGQDKLNYIQDLGPETCIAIGNGNIDQAMLQAAGLSIAVVGPEGCSTQALLASDIVVNSIHDALAIVSSPNKLKAILKG